MLEKLKLEFHNPPSEFSLIPFWFLNDSLEKPVLLQQMREFKEKGIDGFVVHPRIGLPKDISYLGEKYMDFVTFIVEQAKQLDMKVVLYDEGMYPSGSAHGKVVENNPEYAARGLRMVQHPCQGYTETSIHMEGYEEIVAAVAVKKIGDASIDFQTVSLLSVHEQTVVFTPPDTDEWVIVFFVSTFSLGTIRGLHFGEDDGEAGAPLAADLLNPDAMAKFIRVTYDAYYAILKEHFGETVIAMFTDEPSVLGRCVDVEQIKPWTIDFLPWYHSLGNQTVDLLALWFDTGASGDIKRRNFDKAVHKKLESTYYKQLSDWCSDHHIALTGHPEGSDDIGCLRYFHIPGQDVVWRWIGPEDNKSLEGQHSTIGKCSSDAARHLGRRRNANECFGCCGFDGRQWEFTADDMKWFMDWLFVRGVNLLYPHAFLYSIVGEERRNERPPDVGPHNAWWKYYDQIALYAKRMSWLMTDSINCTSIAVLCEEDHLPWQIVKPLYQHQMEFNYLEANLLLHSCSVSVDGIKIEQQQYHTVIIEKLSQLDDELNQVLNEFSRQGGCIIVYNPHHIQHALQRVVEIENYHDIIITLEKSQQREVVLLPHHHDLRVSHVIKEGMHFYLLVNEGEERLDGDFVIKGIGHIEAWDPWAGKTLAVNLLRADADCSVISLSLNRRESLILCRQQAGMAQVVDQTGSCGEESTAVMEVQGPWMLKKPSGQQTLVQELLSWTTDETMEGYSGAIVYETEVKVSEIRCVKKAMLCLGTVGEMARLCVNGQEVGIKMWAPFEFDITPFITPNDSNLNITVEVTNSISNKLAQSSVQSGLLGPVTVKLFL